MLIYTSALILCVIACAHSYLGESHILKPLFAEDHTGILRHQPVQKLLRWVWHWMSIGMVGFAALLIVMKGSPFETIFVWASIGLWAFTALMCLYCAGPTHPGFIGFLIVTASLITQRFMT